MQTKPVFPLHLLDGVIYREKQKLWKELSYANVKLHLTRRRTEAAVHANRHFLHSLMTKFLSN